MLNFIPAAGAQADDETGGLPETIVKIKPSIVGIGTYNKIRRPPAVVSATGFIVLDGRHAITNAHAIPEKLDEKHNETLAVFTGQGQTGKIHEAAVVYTDKDNDLCLLSFQGDVRAPITLGDDSLVREGETYAFTGYPIGAVLGLYAATHIGIVSAITPIAIPANAIRTLDKTLVERLQSPYSVFQLDATAYPGNSGSPLYNIGTGAVIGIVNKVYVKGAKENALTNPSGITYAIPIHFVKKLLEDYSETRGK